MDKSYVLITDAKREYLLSQHNKFNPRAEIIEYDYRPGALGLLHSEIVADPIGNYREMPGVPFGKRLYTTGNLNSSLAREGDIAILLHDDFSGKSRFHKWRSEGLFLSYFREEEFTILESSKIDDVKDEVAKIFEEKDIWINQTWPRRTGLSEIDSVKYMVGNILPVLDNFEYNNTAICGIPLEVSLRKVSRKALLSERAYLNEHARQWRASNGKLPKSAFIPKR